MKKLVFIMIMFHGTLFAQNQAVNANYSLAERFSSSRIDKMVFDTKVIPNWLSTNQRFWYRYKTTKETFYYIVDLTKKTKEYLFDNHEMARMLSLITKNAYNYQHLPQINPKFKKNDAVFQFDISVTGGQRKTYHLEYDIKTHKLYELSEKGSEKRSFSPGWLNVSPDSSYAVYLKGYNLYYMDKANYLKAGSYGRDMTIIEHQLTNDGVEGYSYAKASEVNGRSEDSNNVRQYPQPAEIVWSPDSKKFALIKKDNRKLKPLWVINSLTNPRPTLLTYKYQMPGEIDLTEAELLVFTIENNKVDTIPIKKFNNQTITIPEQIAKGRERSEGVYPDIWLSQNSNELYFSRQSRDLHKYDFCLVNLETKKVKVLIEEDMNTYVEVNDPILINGGKEIIHLSERDGWAHFYLYDNNGNMERQITSGPWHCSYDGYAVDEKRRTLYFNANGRETAEDPYYNHFYKVHLDGSAIKLLNKGNFDHKVELNGSKKYFVNNYSRVNATPKSEVRDINGKLVLKLETADLSSLIAAGYKFPEPFKAKADDGITDIYGVMYKPFDFDSTKTYPIIEHVYPGPHTEAVNKAFSTNMDRTDRMAQLGFIVISLGNRGGSPQRSKWYHDYGYGNMRDYGLADKKYVVEQLAYQHSFIDINRVGIFGHSGGGFMSAAAMCQYPDFYKVAISASGNHDNKIYNHLFTEKYNGIKEVINDKDGSSKFLYEVETNPQIAANLKGHLLLVTGDVDYNVNPASTFRMANALVKANKRFDMFIMPGESHIYRNTEYFFWLFADYFVKHLLGNSTMSVDISEMNREFKKSPGKNDAK